MILSENRYSCSRSGSCVPLRQRTVNAFAHRCRHLRQPQPIRMHQGGLGADDDFSRRHNIAKRRHWRLSAKLLIAASVATMIGFSAICVSVMFDMRRGEEELARQMLENLAAGIDADIGRNIELYDCRCARSPAAWRCRRSAMSARSSGI